VFNLQGSELVIILLLALVVLGPEKLPDAMRKMGQFYAQMKKMSSGFQQEFKAAVDQPMREVRETANLLRDSMDFRNFQDGAREEKPKSAEMATLTPPVDAAPEAEVAAAAERTPTDDVPFQEPAPQAGHPIDVPVETQPPDTQPSDTQPPETQPPDTQPPETPAEAEQPPVLEARRNDDGDQEW
jgi:sec-independent protein translocase protein TatB